MLLINANYFLQINNDIVKAIPYKRNILSRKIKCFNESFVDKAFYAKLKNRGLVVIIEGEELFINLITLPKVKNSRIYDLVKNELLYKFNKLDNIIFHYEIIKEKEESYEVVVYCVNIENFNVLKKENYNNSNFIKINLLQNFIKGYLSSSIKDEDYYLAFRYKRDFYFILVSKDNIIANRVVKINKEITNISEEFVAFINSYKEELKYINKIYTMDVTLTNAQLKDFIVVKLKDLNTKDFVNYAIKKG